MDISQISKKPSIIVEEKSRKKSGLEDLLENSKPKKKLEKPVNKPDRESDPRGFNLLADEFKNSPVKSKDYNLLSKNDKPKDINKEYNILNSDSICNFYQKIYYIIRKIITNQIKTYWQL